MKQSVVLSWIAFTIVLIAVPVLSIQQSANAFSGTRSEAVNGGVGCASCTLIVALVEQITTVNNVSVVDFVSRELCQMFTGQFNMLCGFLVTIWGPAVVEKLINNETPDVICYSLGICHADPGSGYCNLFPLPEGGLELAIENSRTNARITPTFPWHMTESLPDACHLPGIRQVCDAMTNTFSNHIPAVDLDRDKFSVVQSFRGAYWRGKDCDDVNEFIYPGRKSLFNDFVFDSNCNGIKGANPVTGLPYEKELCDGTDQYGIIYIGDSIGAHFHIPEQWLTASKITRNIFQNMSLVMSNQFDWPHLAFSTGYSSVNWPIMKGSSFNSLYQRLRQRNLCNHRDFQNVCFNGAETSTMRPFLPSISREKQRDKPAIVFYALMGNDVCRRFMNRTDQLTTPEEYRESVMSSLTYLNSILPNGSHIVLMGLVNGSFIFPSMAHRMHPIGQLRGDVNYANVYDWWNCMRIGPCYGWMNRDAAYRDATTVRAAELTETLKNISETVKFDTVSLHFLPNPLQEVLNRWEALGREKWEALEPIDSMHPIHEVQPLIADVIWEGITQNFPHILGRENPKNDIIRQLFGDQRGH